MVRMFKNPTRGVFDVNAPLVRVGLMFHLDLGVTKVPFSTVLAIILI